MDFLVMDLDHSSHHYFREHALFSVELGSYKRKIPGYGQSPVPLPGCITQLIFMMVLIYSILPF